jgi:Ca2+-binding RTX toxin-like protein
MATITGTNGADSLNGTEEDDLIQGLAGEDTLLGNGGNDVLDGGAGADNMFGGVGDDTYLVNNPNDLVSEALDEGYDTVRANLDWALEENVEALELVRSSGNNAVLRGWGNSGDNNLTGSSGRDYLWGGAGSDGIDGGRGNDRLYGDDGDDGLGGGRGDDIVEGGGGNDNLGGGLGEDVLRGGAGDDFLTGVDDFDGGGIRHRDVVWGGAGDDFLQGDHRDILRGGTGNDLYQGEARTKIIEHADEGIDTILIRDRSYDMNDAPNVENLVIGGDGVAFGNSGDNIMRGSVDTEGRGITLHGRGGDDHLVGVIFDSNTYTGGSGQDTFYGTSTHADPFSEREIVTDFEGGIDRIGFEREVDAPTRWMTAEQFHSGDGAVAQTAEHRYIYDTDSGYLYYDGDGSGASEAYVIWEIHMKSGELSHNDFYYMPDIPFLG